MSVIKNLPLQGLIYSKVQALSLIFMNLFPLLVTALWWWLTRKLRSFGHSTVSPKNCNFIFCSVPFLSFFVLLRLLIIYCNQNKCEWKMNEWKGKWTAQDDHFAGLVWPSSTKYCWQRSSVQIVFPPSSQVKPVSTLLKMWNPWINPFTPKSDLTDFTLSDARWFYSSKGDPLGVKGLID